MKELPGYIEALKTLKAHTTPRAEALHVLEQFVEGTQYDHLDNFFTGKKPLWERAPCVVYPIAKMAIDSNADLLLGEGRFPSFTVEGAEGDEADEFEKAVSRVIKHARLNASSREAFTSAQASKSACSIFGIQSGRLTIQSVFARWCTPTFDTDGSVAFLEIKYPYLDVISDGDGSKKVVCKLYRRTIDSTFDTIYHTARVEEQDVEKPINWAVDIETVHAFGFCPVVWYAHMRSCSIVNEYDGHAIHEHQLDEIRAHDFLLSQGYRAAMYCGDPQIIEIGVRKGYNAGEKGRKGTMPGLLDALPAAGGGFFVGAPSPGSGEPARRKGPGEIWQYDVQDASKVKVSMLTLPGDALKVIEDRARDMKGKLAEALGVVFIDASSLPNESRLSGKALNDLVRPQLARVNSYRDDFSDHYLIPSIGMLLRIAIKTGLPIEGIEVVKARASKATWSWHFPPLQATWGEYFKMSGDEELAVMQATLPAVGILLTKKAAVEKLKGILGIKDVDSYMAELEKETAENEAKELAKVEAEAKATAAAKPKPAPAKAA